MKKIIVLFFMTVMTVSLWAVPPMDYAGKDGSLKPETVSSGKSPFLKSPEASARSGKAARKVSSSGTKYIPVVLVDFPDRPFLSGHDKNYYKKIYETDTEKLTMKEYYKTMSDNNLVLEFQIYGPYTAAKHVSYYGADDDKNVGELIKEIIDCLISDPEGGASTFDENSRFDSDSIGGVDVLLVIYAGSGEDSTGIDGDIWAHKWDVKKAFASAGISGDPYNFNEYTIQSETSTRNSETGIGAACHEFGHILGLPDLYDIDYETSGLGDWSVMSGGSWGSIGTEEDPAPMTAYERYKLGWLTPQLLNPDVPGTVEFRSDLQDPEYKAYRINLTDDGKQFLMLEGKKKKADGTGMFVPESGLFITQINEERYEAAKAANRVNTGKNRIHAVDVLEAVTTELVDENYTGSWGSLWTTDSKESGTVAFRSETRTQIGPSFMYSVLAGSALLLGISLFRKKNRGRALFLTLCAAAMLFASCSLEIGSSGKKVLFKANTNYYTGGRLESKTGISGVVISDITFNETTGIGSFSYSRER